MLAVSPKVERANIFHLYSELLWMSVAFALEWYYLQVYAIRLGATPAHLGALTAGRALMMVVGTSLTSRWLARHRNVIRALAAPILVYRTLIYFCIALVPFLPGNRVEALVALAVISAVPHGIAQGTFLGMLPLAVNKSSLGKVVSRRSVMLNVAVLICVLFFGGMLEWLPFPVNYQVAFCLAYLATLMGSLHIQRIKVPDIIPAKASAEQGAPVRVWHHAAFRRFAILLVGVNLSVFLMAPLTQLHLVRNLAASDAWIALFGISEMAAGALFTIRLDWFVRRFGTRNLIIATMFATVLQPLILGLTPTLAPFVIGSIAFGAGWFAINVLMYNLMVEIIPPDQVTRFAATYQLLINVCLFAGPLIGTFLIQYIMTIPAALLLIAGMRLIIAVLARAMPQEPDEGSIVLPLEPLETAHWETS